MHLFTLSEALQKKFGVSSLEEQMKLEKDIAKKETRAGGRRRRYVDVFLCLSGFRVANRDPRRCM